MNIATPPALIGTLSADQLPPTLVACTPLTQTTALESDTVPVTVILEYHRSIKSDGVLTVITVLSWPVFVESWTRNEVSSDAGGLLRWPVKLLIPVGFLLLVLQGISEIIKRVAFLLGRIPDPAERHVDPYLDEMKKLAE